MGEGIPNAWVPAIFICCTFNLSQHPNSNIYFNLDSNYDKD